MPVTLSQTKDIIIKRGFILKKIFYKCHPELVEGSQR